MSSEQKYFHDRIVLVLLTVFAFLVVIGSLLILLRLDGGRNEGYIVQYRSNLGVSPFKSGRAGEIVAFIPFMLIVLIVSVILSMRMHKINAKYASIILGLGVLLVILSMIVSNALLVV